MYRRYQDSQQTVSSELFPINNCANWYEYGIRIVMVAKQHLIHLQRIQNNLVLSQSHHFHGYLKQKQNLNHIHDRN